MNIHQIPGVVTMDLYRHLKQLDRENLWQEAIESIEETLLAENGDYYPFTITNLSEAIGEIDITAIAASLKAGNYQEAGKTFTELVIAYWEHKAQQKAKREIKKLLVNTCPCCRSWRCNYCDEK